MNPTQSKFFSQFSLQKLVEKNKSSAGLVCSAGRMGGIGGGGGGVGRREFRHHKGEAFSCRIKRDQGEQFDEAEFIASLKEDVEKEIIASGTKIIDRGTLDASSFYFEYGVENIRGHIDISGKKVRENYYSLRADLDKKGKKDAE
ncbi:MAG: hypothetical protein ACR2IB_01360 [Pyrinomonadaceae bacterium]